MNTRSISFVFCALCALSIGCEDTRSRPDTGTTEMPMADSGTGGTVDCDWPTGETGVDEGQVLDRSLSWQGLAPGGNGETTIEVAPFFDCDGSRGIHALLITTSQYFCGNCTAEARSLSQNIADWAADGLNIAVVTLKLENPDESRPATLEAAQTWRDEHNLTTSYVGYDNNYSMIPRTGGGGVSFGTPYATVVDTRTMQVVESSSGYDPNYRALLETARRNAGN